jgi:hypothetical protein
MTRRPRRRRLPDASSLAAVLDAAVTRARLDGWQPAAVDADLAAHGLPALADTTGRDVYAVVAHLGDLPSLAAPPAPGLAAATGAPERESPGAPTPSTHDHHQTRPQEMTR